MLANNGLNVTSVNIPGIDNNIVSGTREMREFTNKVLSDLVDICGDWQIPYCIFVPGRTMPLLPNPKEQLMEWFVEGITALAQRASDQGVTILIENVPKFEIFIFLLLFSLIKRMKHSKNLEESDDEKRALEEIFFIISFYNIFFSKAH